MIARKPDWPERLNAALDDVQARPFAWAAWDCCHFVAHVVEAMTGADPLAEYRGGYADEAEAWRVLTERDGNLRAACKRIFGKAIKPAFARRGDVVLLRGGMTIGICVGAMCAFAGEAGLVWHRLDECMTAFPLGWPAPEDFEASDG